MPARWFRPSLVALTVLCTAAVLAAVPARAPAATSSRWRIVTPSDKSYAGSVKLVVADLERFWKQAYEDAYGDTLPGGLRFYAARDGEAFPPNGCGATEYDDVRGNAFYCGRGDVIIWDDDDLIPAIEDAFGEIGVAVVLAHEVGHAIQARAEVNGASVLIELQADCFAGAWLADVNAGGSKTIRPPGEDSFNAALAATLAVRDRPGTNPLEPNAHGSGFDRVSAAWDGIEKGATMCARYDEDAPEVTQAAFAPGDEQSGGNIPYADTRSTSLRALNAYWRGQIRGLRTPTLKASSEPGLDAARARCEPSSAAASAGDHVVVCRATSGREVAFDDRALRRVHADLGDFAVTAVLARAWSLIAYRDLGLKRAATFASVDEQVDCLTGTFMRSVKEDGLLSAGDLDEAVIVTVRETGKVSPFKRIAAMRQGYLRGVSACR